ncbi:MAG: hypothetical protein ABH856_02225 [Patescibacteria group bacterium]|nr:hypothetical protein [Patescibacteria group bacterium]
MSERFNEDLDRWRRKYFFMKSMVEKDYFRIPEEVPTYSADGRMSVQELYGAFEDLAQRPGWRSKKIFSHSVVDEKFKPLGIRFPVVSLMTQIRGRALWVISGIHGEEPAGPNAIAENVELFDELRQRGIPIVMLPMCNPAGYFRDWRYPASRRHSGASVGDNEHLLEDYFHAHPRSRKEKPSCRESYRLANFVLDEGKEYPPRLVLDFHEDEDLRSGPVSYPYIYSQGPRGVSDPVAAKVVDILKSCGMGLKMEGGTRFEEPIVNGVVAVNDGDGSIDELLAAKYVVVGGKKRKKPAADSVIVIETPIKDITLRRRIDAHAAVMRQIPDLWDAALVRE